MKTIFSRSVALLALGLSLGLSSCDDKLDINPSQSIDATTALGNQANVGSAVVGMYAQLGGPTLYGTDLILVPELMAADNYIQFQGSFTQYRALVNRTTNASTSTAETTWRDAYEAINTANLVIDALPVVTTPALKSQYEGEARFVRAMLYFELVRLYGKQYEPGGANAQLGVPITLVPVKSLEQATVPQQRATVAQVYTQVINDLTSAIALLPEENPARATTFTAKALLARVYLQQSNFAQARILADDVIRNSGKALSPTLSSVFTGRNTSETLLEIQQNDQNNAGTSNNGLATFFSSIGQQGRGDVRVLPAFANLYGANDARGTASLLYEGTGTNRAAGQLRTGKWIAFGQNIPLIRLAEMYLIRAEADFRAGNIPSALVDINRVRTRSTATPLTAPQLSLATILRERQLELAFEGFRLHDLKRTRTNIFVPASGNNPAREVDINSDILVLPIPLREINVEPGLIQNPGY
ncbi:RagB/SusD family nutrient uptake outer membrane protein [Hymenobacter qilianensis]|uniref:RagB/SusD family nutrient uptake outer membrane protein n=1 Tax=Hymenobacter qilianensis TaxID=1385715 RepID=A0A7H0GRI9_9BACT|nr:RagB/SusD family nutrient uptake outer membrane protein [Hymenobacter qilianensis]QNP50905.1 RagB/SusD family nutrient uptake outer membrane protein [Hymenobacter qilianensis]